MKDVIKTAFAATCATLFVVSMALNAGLVLGYVQIAMPGKAQVKTEKTASMGYSGADRAAMNEKFADASAIPALGRSMETLECEEGAC